MPSKLQHAFLVIGILLILTLEYGQTRDYDAANKRHDSAQRRDVAALSMRLQLDYKQERLNEKIGYNPEDVDTMLHNENSEYLKNDQTTEQQFDEVNRARRGEVKTTHSDSQTTTAPMKPPHIIFILADDLGFNDVGFRGSAQIPTPNIDALAYSGLILNQYYVNPICTPSRSALMTGKYPIHTGMQHTVLYGAEPRGLPLTEKIMPEYFNALGYSSHMAGKWHLGHFKREYTPLQRGFRSHVGFWTGHHDFYDHTAVEQSMWGLDMRRGMDVAYDLHGKYTTDVVTDESVRVIAEHNSSQPLFLYVAHGAVHSGNPYDPLRAPDATVAKLKNIEHLGRRKYAAMVSELDTSVGRIVEELHHRQMLQDSVIVFSTDNGGPAQGFNLNHASNWPLRGVKNTLWEGGVRGAALLWSPRLRKPARVAQQVMHITDWLPTLLAAADYVGSEPRMHEAAQPDSFNVWQALSHDEESPRHLIVHNIDPIWGCGAISVDQWKLLIGTNYNGAWDGWYGPAGIRNPKLYEPKQVRASSAGVAIANLGLMPSEAEIMKMRNAAQIQCAGNVGGGMHQPHQMEVPCFPLKAPCLFNVREDPCERINLANKYPDILRKLLDMFDQVNATAVPPGNLPLDPRGNPNRWDYVWTNFDDAQQEVGICRAALNTTDM